MRRMNGLPARGRARARRARTPVARVRATRRSRPAATGAARAPKRVLSPRLLLAGVLALALYFAVLGGDYSVFEARRAEARLEATRAETRAVRDVTDAMRARMDSLRHGDEALERFARERYGFIRDGEYLYRIPEPQGAAQGESGPPGDQRP